MSNLIKKRIPSLPSKDWEYKETITHEPKVIDKQLKDLTKKELIEIVEDFTNGKNN